jgi:MscS family membrane protein
MSPRTRSFLFLCLVLALVGNPVQAQLPTPVLAPASPSDASPEVPAPPEQLSSPRRTLQTFMEAVPQASPLRPDLETQARATLDLEALNPVTRNERGADVARRLHSVLQVLEVTPSDLPEVAQEATLVVARAPSGEITMTRQPDGSWLFSRHTVAAIPSIYAELVSQGRISSPGQDMPTMLRSSFFGLIAWQWLALILLALSTAVLTRVLVALVQRLGSRWLRHHQFKADEHVLHQVVRPVGWLVACLLWMAVLPMLQLPETVLVVLLFATRFLAASAWVLTAYHSIDLVSLYFSRLADRTDSKLDEMLVPLVRRTLKVVIVVLGLIFVAQNLNINVWSLFAGFSIVGAAVALAGQDTVKNLFGSITVLLDRPFQVGDWVNIGGVDGTVEDLGFRSTRIRTFYNSLVSLPNAQLLTASVDNYGQRQFRRYTTTLCVLYSTPAEKLEAFCEGIRELVQQHPYTRKDYYHVYVNDLGASSIDILLYVFFACPDWSTELRERHRLILDILRLAAELGVEFAFPTSTVHLFQGEKTSARLDGLTAQEMTAHEELGRQAARRIARATLSDQIPPPVAFPSAPR